MNVLKQNELHTLLKAAQECEGTGNLTQAEALYRQIVERDPACDGAWHAMGLLALRSGQLTLAVQRVENAIARKPDSVLYHRNLCEMQRRQGQLRKAEGAGLQACRLAPADTDAHYNLGLVYADLGQYADAVRLYQRALQCNPAHGPSWNNLGSALERVHDRQAARMAYEQAIMINPRHVEAQINLGVLLFRERAFDAARRCFAAAVAAQPESAEAHYYGSLLKTFRAGDPQLALLETLYAARGKYSPPARLRLCFAFGKALYDTGSYERSFAAYEEGNYLRHHLAPADDARDEAELERMLQVFHQDFSRRHSAPARGGESRRTPVFVVGMPGAGTDMLGHLLVSHDALSSSVEPNVLRRAAAHVFPVGQPGLLADAIAQLSSDDLQRIGQAYMQVAWQHAPDSPCVIDQTAAGFFYLGLLHLALPHAKIIHLVQDPMDACIECYTRLPENVHAFASDQTALGRMYARYRVLMRHWQQVLPPGTIYDVQEGQLTTDANGTLRGILEFLGLPTDAQEISALHKQIGEAAPAADWNRFARHLRPLYEVVKEWRPANDDVPLALLRAQLPNREADLHHEEGIRRYKQGRLDQALALFEHSLVLKPDFAEALNSKGYVVQDLGRLDEALSCFARSVALAPELSIPRLNLGMLQLKLGHWKEGWENYEARWTGSAEASKGSIQRPHCPLPAWNGETDTHDKRILIITEQGFGDAFQFSRYLTLLAKRFAKVGFACAPSTQRLMEWSFSEDAVIFTRMPADFDAWDLQCSVMSLPRAFGTLPDTVPAEMPYLKVPRPAATHWRERIVAAAPGRLRVGIAWAGRKSHHNDARRSLQFEQIQPLLADPRIAWFSLQKWAPDEQPPVVSNSVQWFDWMDECTDFADTAAMVSGLDLVISVDSAMVHLAGALGKQVWMMNRFDGEWRWFHRRGDSPWYPTLHIFNARQFGRWQDVIEEIAGALQQLDVAK